MVLPAEPSVDLVETVRKAGRDRAELLLLSVGYPQSAAQQELVAQALDLGSELCVPVEARLVWTLDEAKILVETARDVSIAASGPDRKRLQAILKTPHPALAGVATWEPHEPAARDGTPKTAPPSESDANAMRTESVEALAGRQVPKPTVKAHWTAELARDRKKGSLRIYLGAAPGVGKTFAMLGEGQRRKSRGTGVVVGFVETYGRPLTQEMLAGLEVVPRRLLPYRGSLFEEMNSDAVIDRHPGVALVDELAHTNVPGSRRAKRWEDVLDILAAGIDVVTTLNVQHLESLNDVVVNITSIRQQETVPDWVVDLGDQVELVDMSPEALQRRMRHGNVYPDPAKSELALRRFFTLENLTALRELALMRVADRVDADLLERWSKESVPETRERILVCVSGSDLSEALVRRGGRMAHRVRGDLFVLHVRTGEDRFDPAVKARIEELTRDLGGELHVVDADSVVDGILGFVRRYRVTQCVVGEPLRPAWRELLGGSWSTG